MKNKILSYSLVASMLTISLAGCDDSELETPIEKEIAAPSLEVYQPVVAGPNDLIQTAEAKFNVPLGDYRFVLSAVTTDGQEDLSQGNTSDLFSIDEKTGQISISSLQNMNATELAFGTYHFSVSITYMGGVASFEDIASIEIIELPFNIAYSQENSIDVSFGQLGQFATPNIVSEDDELNIEEYELTSAPEGITIDSQTGALSKTSKSVVAGTHSISLRVKTNKGIKEFKDIITINVGQQPELFFTNMDTQFSTVNISTWSGFTAQLGGPIQELGEELSFVLKDTDVNGLTIDELTGDITLAEDSNLSEGSYQVGIAVVDQSGFEVAYPQMFTIVVANSWEQFSLDHLDVSGYADKEIRAIDDQYSYYKTTSLNGSDLEFVSYKHMADKNTGFAASGFAYNFGKTIEIDASLIREVDMDDSFRRVKLSFDETSVANIQKDGVLRRLYFGYNDEDLILNNTFEESQWNLLIADDSDKWAVNNYKSGYKNIEAEFEVDASSSDKLFIHWRVSSTIPSSGYTRGAYDNVNIKVMKKTTPLFE